MANSRIQRWALTLSAYTYTVRYRPGLQNGNADACSRLPLQTGFKDPPLPVEFVLQLERVDLGPVSVDDIRQATLSDATLGQVSKLILEGWPENPDQDKNLSPYFKKRFELSVEGGVVLWGNRIVIPNVLRGKILQELHSTHQGVTGMKSIARSLLWWPNLIWTLMIESELAMSAFRMHTCPPNICNPGQLQLESGPAFILIMQAL
ncbi:hypothetical protein JTE90_020773 [Oedothorax gibbosus]|uniref:RNA-directed DNA polymerase n=1 Tax=Oedothorax gibbosus TaxID=931172 RepID=A0AAV6TSB1_9ARAC|nr:hypothetical protein JTE90_020773 [Oedothorax gibbosus]